MTDALAHLPNPTQHGQLGTLYLAHFGQAVGSGARHYLGWSSKPDERVIAHRCGRSRVKLMQLANEVGWEIVATWPGMTRQDERRMKNRGGLAEHCPLCRAAWLQRRNATQRARRARDGRADRPRKAPRGPLRGGA